MHLSFAALERADGFGEYALVGFGPKWVRAFGHNLKRKTAADYRLAKFEGPGPKDPAKKCHFPFDYFKLAQNEWREGRLEIGKCLKMNALWW